MKERHAGPIFGTLFLAFLAAMAACTVLSRALDSVTVPKVEFCYAKNGTVSYQILGEGSFVADDLSYFYPEPNIRIAKVEGKAGQEIHEGDVMFIYQMKSLEEKRDELALRLEKLDLEYQQLCIQRRQTPAILSQTAAAQSLDAAARELERGKEELEQVRQHSEEKLERLKRDYDRKMDQSEEEREEEARQAVQDARLAYEAAEARGGRAVKNAERQVEKCQKDLDRLSGQSADEEELRKARERLDEAKVNLEDVEEEQEFAVEEARRILDQAEKDDGEESTGDRTSAETLTSDYEAAVEAQQDKVSTAKRTVRELEEALVRARQGVENAAAEDERAAENDKKTGELIELQMQERQLDIAQAKEDFARLCALIEANGTVLAPCDGILTSVSMEAGKESNGDEEIAICKNQLKFSGKVDKKEGELLDPGTEMTLRFGDGGSGEPAIVESVDFITSESEAVFFATVKQGRGRLGAKADFEVNERSGQFDMVIPIAALREDSLGYFILTVEEEKTILGQESVAVRINVDVLEKSSSQAAVSGPITKDMKIISGGSRIISEGDRIRPWEE